MALSEIVSVTISAGTVNPARAGFGVPLILCYHTGFGLDEVRTYTTFAGLAADFDADTENERKVYEAGLAIFSQSPRPSSVKVAALDAPSTAQVFSLDFTSHASGDAIELTLTAPNGTEYEVSEAWNTNIATTLAALETTVEALGGGTVFTLDDAGSPVATITLQGSHKTFDVSVESAGCDIKETTLDWDYDDRLDDVLLLDAQFYAVIVESNSPKNMDKVARWCLANDRIAGFAPQYDDPGDFVSGQFSAGADYTALLANDAAFGLFTQAPRSSFMEAAWLGRMLPTDPGSATWAFKQLAGVGADPYTSTQRTTIESSTNHGNHYTTEAGVDITRPGKMFGGEWIDVVIGLAWLEARIQEGQFALLVNNDKIPYTDAGIGLMAADLRRVLQVAEDRGVIDSGWTIEIPTAASQDPADRADRILRDLHFQARLAGAIHSVTILGSVTA